MITLFETKIFPLSLSLSPSARLLPPLSLGLFPPLLLPPSVALRLGVPAVMVCAVGAAGMAITIHGSLAEAGTQWTHMREGEGEGRSEGEVKKLAESKKKKEADEEKKMAALAGYYIIQLL